MPTIKKSKALLESVEVDIASTLDLIAKLGFGVALRRLPPDIGWTLTPDNKLVWPNTWSCIATYMKQDKSVPGAVAICGIDPGLLVFTVYNRCLRLLEDVMKANP